MNTKPILRIRKNYRFVMQWAIFSNSYLSTLVKRKMLFPNTVDYIKSISFRLRDEPGMMDKYNEYNELLKKMKGLE